MNQKDIIQFFDRCAPGWDADMVRNENVIETILNNAGVREEIRVLDVACGTGVLFPDYEKRRVGELIGIDISPKMVEIARKKYPEHRILCADVQQTEFEDKFDVIMIYNAFPHFPEPELLIRHLSGMLKPDGVLSVAHGMSKEALDRHHEGAAKEVSLLLPQAETLAAWFTPYLEVTTVISDERMYQVVGKKTEK